MTIRQFFRRLKSVEGAVFQARGPIRIISENKLLCPIEAVGGIWQMMDGGLDLSEIDHRAIIRAADGVADGVPYTPRERYIRRRMLEILNQE